VAEAVPFGFLAKKLTKVITNIVQKSGKWWQ
jgi:hypothetical protein